MQVGDQPRRTAEDRTSCQVTVGYEPHDEDPDMNRNCAAWWPSGRVLVSAMDFVLRTPCHLAMILLR